MATPIFSEVITAINTYIVANGNNEITANVLNPILQIMTNFTNNTIGNLDDLTTDEKNSIVEAINSLKINFDDLNNTGVQLHTGYDDPNVTPPLTYNYADFYMQLDSVDDSPIYLWQYNGIEWVTDMVVPVGTGISSKRYVGAGQDYELPIGAIAFKGWINDGIQHVEDPDFLSDLNTITQSGTTVTFKMAITAGKRIIIDFHY